jgi:hypothetical protein
MQAGLYMVLLAGPGLTAATLWLGVQGAIGIEALVNALDIEARFRKIDRIDKLIQVVAGRLEPPGGIPWAAVVGRQGGMNMIIKSAQLLTKIIRPKVESDIWLIQVLIFEIGPL